MKYVSCFFLCIVPAVVFAQASLPISDTVYLQEIGNKINSADPVTSVAAVDDRAYAATHKGLFRVDGDSLISVDGLTGAITHLEAIDGALYAIAGEALFRLQGDTWKQLGTGAFVDLCKHLGEVCVATKDELFTVTGDALTPIEFSKSNQPILAVASYSGTLYVLRPGSVALLDPVIQKGFDRENVADWGLAISRDTRDLLAQGSRLLVGTDRGLAQLRGMAWTTIRGEDGLPYEDVVCLREGFDGDLWIGTTRGAIRHTDGAFHYFNADRWLPHTKVNDIAVSSDTAYIATDGGIGIIRFEPYTLAKKAAYIERHLDEWGQKRLGFTHKLEWNGAESAWVREVSDNDVGWSTHYLTAMSFKYAVTKDADARKEALDFYKSLLWSEEISGIPGFPARSVWAVGERGHQAQHGSGGLPAEWHPTEDGKWQWKGDTSSDETDAHFYAAPIFMELVANDKERARGVEHLRRIAAHIVDHGWTLHDVDGKPTRWARWDPEYLHGKAGFYAQGLNGMEILTYMQTAYAFTKDSKFSEGKQALIELGYPRAVVRQKLTFHPGFIFHSDDRLAFYTYYSLLKYETDPALRSIYLRSIERSWEVERIEHNPWFNFIYGAMTGNDCEADKATQHLRDWPLDMIDYSFTNSHRTDLHTPHGYLPYSGGIKAISPRERGPHRWTDSTLELDGGSGGQNVVDPAGWLDAYWMGRYYGFIGAPETKDPELTTVPKRNERHGAAPYDGPERPELKDGF